MTGIGARVRDAVSATRRADEAERQRDDARGARQHIEAVLDGLQVELAAIDQQLVRRGFTAQHDRADAVRALVDGLADEASCGDVLGDVAEVLGLRGAPEKWNTREIMTALHTLRAHGGRADRAEDLIAEVGAWVASITGEHPSPEVRLVDAVRRAAVVNAATLREERDHAREAADAWRPGNVPARASRLIEEERRVHAVAAHDRSHVMFSGLARGYTDQPTFVIELPDGTRRSWVAALVVEAGDQQSPTDSEETRDDTVRRLAREIMATRDVLAPGVDTTGTPLEEVARASLRSARAIAAADELRWWSQRPGSLHESLAARARQLDPSGTVPEGDQPPTPTIFRADPVPRVPRRAAAGLVANLTAAAVRTGQARDVKAGHPEEVLRALRIADEHREILGAGVIKELRGAVQVLARAVRAYTDDDDVVDATIGCGAGATGGRPCGLPEHHEGDHMPSWTVLDDQQVAREAMYGDVLALGHDHDAAQEIVDALARAGFVPGVYPPGMAIDGDMLRSLITDALPRWATDEFAGELADSVLDAAVRAGFTILHGKNPTPRANDVPDVLSGAEEPVGMSELSVDSQSGELFDGVRRRVGVELIDHHGREGRAVRHVMAALHDVLRERETAAQV